MNNQTKTTSTNLPGVSNRIEGIRTSVRSGGGMNGTGGINHNQTQRVSVRTNVRSGGNMTGTGGINHNQTQR